MRHIEIFYHLYIPADIRASQWAVLFDQHMKLIKQSKINDLAKFNMAITMPKHWTHMWGIPFRVDQNSSIEITFSQKIQEYVSVRYPWVNILDIRDTGDTNLYEGQTLKFLYDRCCQDDNFDVLYFHSKGTVSGSPCVMGWREILDYYCITQWPSCLDKLKQASVVGVSDGYTNNIIMSGNFWWAKSEHIKTLPDPLRSDLYMGDQHDFYPIQPAYRYAFERWILSNNPEVFYMIDTKANHYDNYCFLENLI